MFRIYDLNYKEVSFPVDDLGLGLKSLDIDIGPILYENIYTQSSRADKLVKRYPKDRTVTLHAMFTSYNKNVADWRLKRDVIYEFFRTLGVFYVAEEYQPFKLIKVLVDTDYLPDRPVNIWGMLEIPLKIIDTPFKQSLHTTSDIDSEGVRWNDKWGYGMGLSSERERWKYSFEPNPTAVNLDKTMFEQGSMFLSNGQNADGNTQLGRLKNHYSVIKGQSYRLNLNETGGTINYIRVFHYDASGNHISNEGTTSVNGNGSTSLNFVALGTSVRLLVYANGSAQVNISGIGTLTKISLSGYSDLTHKFRLYNAGTEEIKLIQQKESVITLVALTAASSIEIFDGEKTFRIDRPFKIGDRLTLKGHQIRVNNANVLHHTNRTFLTVKKGWNEWQIKGIANFEFDTDFRFLYD